MADHRFIAGAIALAAIGTGMARRLAAPIHIGKKTGNKAKRYERKRVKQDRRRNRG